MSAVYELVIEGPAHTKNRPRVTAHGTFTPAKTHEWEDRVGWEFVIAHGRPVLLGPLAVDLVFEGRHPRQDVDNLAKAVLDGLNGIAFADDCQVMALSVAKTHGGQERTRIRLWELPS